MRILFIGDVVGNKGLAMVKEYLPKIKQEYKPQVTIVNGENATPMGRGINLQAYKKLMSSGVDVVTLGNHAWSNKEVFEFIDDTKKLVRPFNFPGSDVPGRGYTTVNVNGVKLIVANFQGRVFLDNLDDPFALANELFTKLRKETKCIFVDFHAEATSEKIGFAMYLDGKVSAVIGTHTHVQTNDARILKNGTAFLSDVGMAGPADGMLGMKPENVIGRFLNQRPTRFEALEDGRGILSGVIVDINNETGKASNIKPILITEGTFE